MRPITITLVLALASVAAAQETVGGRGRPAALTFDGVAAWSPEAIRDGLARTGEFWLTGHPEAPLGDFVESIRTLVERGYRHGGFATAHVTAKASAERIAVAVKEGLRSRCGAIRISPGEADILAEIVTRLTTAQDAKGAPAVPLWPTGEPAPFDRPTRDRIRNAVLAVLGERGHLLGEARVEARPGADGTATLVVSLEPGPKAVVASIEVPDGLRSTREAVLERTGLRVGMPCDATVLGEARRRLGMSARFLAVEISRRSPGEQDGKVAVVLDLTEYEHAPPLQEPLGRLEKTLLKSRRWMIDFAAGRIPGALRGTVGIAPLTIGFDLVPRRGVMLRGFGLMADEPGEWVGLAVGPSMAFLGSSSLKRMIVVEGVPTGGRLQVGLRADAADPVQPFTSRFSLGFAKRPVGPWFVLNVDPVACVGLAHHLRKAGTTTFDGATLTVRGDGLLLRVDEASGRPLEFRMDDPAVAIRIGEEAKPDRLLPDLDGFVSAASGTPPRSAVVDLLLEIAADALARSPDAWGGLRGLGPRLAGIRRLIRPGLAALDRRPRTAPDAVGEFRVPVVDSGSMATETILVYGSSIASFLAPPDGWLGLLIREAVSVFAGRGERTRAVLGHLHGSEEFGPLACLTAAWLLPDEQISATFARLGLERLKPVSFLRDCDALLAGETGLGPVLLRAAAALREVDDERAEEIAGSLETSGLAPLVSVVRAIRDGEEDDSLRNAVLKALRAGYEAGLRETLKVALESLADR